MDNLHLTISDPIVAKYVHLARKIARKYAVEGHFILNFEDLYQELQMSLLKCANAAREKQLSENDTYRFVSTSLSNAAKYFLTLAFGKKRNTILVNIDLSDEVSRMSSGDFDAIHERILIQQIREMLSGVPLLVYNTILNPPKAVVELAQVETLRKAHLKAANNVMVRGANVVRITPEIIRRALNLTRRAYNDALDVIHVTAMSLV